jgi:hypothetical protein
LRSIGISSPSRIPSPSLSVLYGRVKFERGFGSTPVVWSSDCDELVLLVLVLLCASITIPLLFKVSIEDINITPKIAISKILDSKYLSFGAVFPEAAQSSTL